MAVVVPFLGLLGGLDMELQVFLYVLQGLEALMRQRNVDGDARDLDIESRMVTMECKERCQARGCMNSVVVAEFSHRQQVNPIILLIVDVTAEILFQCGIGTFRLAVSLRMESCGKF